MTSTNSEDVGVANEKGRVAATHGLVVPKIISMDTNEPQSFQAKEIEKLIIEGKTDGEIDAIVFGRDWNVVRYVGREECLTRYWCEDNGIDPFYWMAYRDNCPYLQEPESEGDTASESEG
jgi:hypothetical protein